MDYTEAMKIAKNRNASFSDRISYVMSAPTIEPVKRKKGNKYPQYQFHRFPLKNGITKRQVMVENIHTSNPLLAIIKETRELPKGEIISIEMDYS